MEILSKEQQKMLLQIGFAACMTGKITEATSIFDGLMMCETSVNSAKVGKALSLIVCDKFADGEGILQELLALDNLAIKDEVNALLCFSAALQKDQSRVDEFAAKVDLSNAQAKALVESAFELLQK